ncbi:hypothetical protein ACFRCW_35560 [Streptomyces sp. NPDC056653]|uniref:hypothetical protein n=1 Tax=Streptomyces sp. NPDC056653 TaxID=3345894 RepID=UPI00368FE17B
MFQGCQPSYHMKQGKGGQWQLRAVLSVPVPGHSSPLLATAVTERSNLALAASAANVLLFPDTAGHRPDTPPDMSPDVSGRHSDIPPGPGSDLPGHRPDNAADISADVSGHAPLPSKEADAVASALLS